MQHNLNWSSQIWWVDVLISSMLQSWVYISLFPSGPSMQFFMLITFYLVFHVITWYSIWIVQFNDGMQQLLKWVSCIIHVLETTTANNHRIHPQLMLCEMLPWEHPTTNNQQAPIPEIPCILHAVTPKPSISFKCHRCQNNIFTPIQSMWVPIKPTTSNKRLQKQSWNLQNSDKKLHHHIHHAWEL